jgi:hypothetical protein
MSNTNGKERNILLLYRTEPRFMSHAATSLVTIPAELFHLVRNFETSGKVAPVWCYRLVKCLGIGNCGGVCVCVCVCGLCGDW